MTGFLPPQVRAIVIQKLGIIPYGAALKIQETICARRKKNQCPDTLLVLEHHPVYTVGKRRTLHNILTSEEELKQIGAEVFETSRGGDVTFHGPGQIVLYPIVNLRALHKGARAYVEGLEDVMIETLKDYGVHARGRVPSQSGVWIGERKIGAVGVQITGGVTMHGLALNAAPDLRYFEHIIPCGLADKTVTSLQQECPSLDVDICDIAQRLVQKFVDVFQYEQRTLSKLESFGGQES